MIYKIIVFLKLLKLIIFGYNFDLFSIFFVFFTGIFVFCSIHKHLLITLLSLEYLVLCVYIFFVFFIIGYSSEIYLVLIFLTFSVCEGVLGLSVLINIIRCHGNDHVNRIFF